MIAFVHINKTAGTTLRYILRSSYGQRHCDVEPWHAPWSDPPFSREDLRRVRKVYPHLASIAGHRVTGYVDLSEPGYQVHYVTFLREPLAMCASRFQYQLDYRKKSNLVFEQWIQKDWVGNAQAKCIVSTGSATDAIRVIRERNMFVGLTEHFDESIVLLKRLRAPDLDIAYTPMNTAKGSQLARHLLEDRGTRQMIVDANQEDLELYEHVARYTYPAFQQEYGASLDTAVSEYRNGNRRRFNRRNLILYGVKQRLLYRPLLSLYRGERSRRVVERLLA